MEEHLRKVENIRITTKLCECSYVPSLINYLGNITAQARTSFELNQKILFESTE